MAFVLLMIGATIIAGKSILCGLVMTTLTSVLLVLQEFTASGQHVWNDMALICVLLCFGSLVVYIKICCFSVLFQDSNGIFDTSRFRVTAEPFAGAHFNLLKCF